MGDLTKTKQHFIEFINHAIEHNKVSHAYLIEVSNYEEDLVFVYDFIKMILCNLSYEELQKSTNPIIQQIDHGNYPDLMIIEPDGNTVKKYQMLNLQKEFKNTSLLNGKKIYIIKNAELMNDASSNTMLKFLEDPGDNVIAFLLTNNRYRMISTILSRCQILSLKEDSLPYELNDELLELLNCIIHPREFFLKYDYYITEVIPDKEVAKEKLKMLENVIVSYFNHQYIGQQEEQNEQLNRIFKNCSENQFLNILSILEGEFSKLVYNINYKVWLDSLFSKLIIGG